MSENYLICAYEFDGKGTGVSIAKNDLAEEIKNEGLAWAHFEVGHHGTRSWIQKNLSYLDPLVVDALLAEETRPRVSEFPEGLLVILRGVNLNENEDEEDMISIRIWIDEHRIISTRKRKLKAVETIISRLESGTGPKSSADFLVMLLTELVANMEDVIIDLNDITDHIEENLLENPDIHFRKQINDVRRKSILLRRYIAPQKEAISLLRLTEVPWIDQRHNRHIQEALDKITRYVEDLDSIRERGQIIKDELSNMLSDRMNKNLYVLSLVAALFLPLSFLTGLLGINVGGLPGVENDMAFWIVCALCAIVFALEYLIFRFMRWL